MKATFAKKLTLFYIPFLLTSIGFCGLYTFLNWVIMKELELFSIKDKIIDLFIPLILSALLVLFYFRPRLKLLALKTRKGSWIDFYTFILWLVISAPVIMAQLYLDKASGKLTKLVNINEIEKQEQTKYYTVENYYIDKSKIGIYYSRNTSGKYNANLNMHLYVVLPILSIESDPLNSNCIAWLCVEYSKQISNKITVEEKKEKYKVFVLESQNDFNKTNFNEFVYLKRVGNSDAGDGFKEALKKSPRYKSTHTALLLPINEPFEERSGNMLAWIFGVYGISALTWLIMITIPKFDMHALNRFENGKPISKENGLKDALDLLKPKEGFFITPILIYANVGIYLAMSFTGLGFISFKGQDLLNLGANFRPLTANGEWWRLITSTFLHGGLIHLLANMYGLMFVGIFLEPLLGRTKYFLFYLFTGILASGASLWWYSATISVGASGAIFGLYGIFLALLLTKVFTADFAKSFLLSTLIFVGFNLLIGLKGGIDNAAHIGGLLSGFILGLIFRLTIKAQEEKLAGQQYDQHHT